MPSLDAFTDRDVQNFKAMLAVFVAAGVTDAGTIGEHLEKHLEERLSMKTEKVPLPISDHCPDCGNTSMRVNFEKQEDGSKWWYEGCPACGYIQPIDGD